MASLLPPGRMENRQLYQQQRGTTAGNNHSRSGNNSNSNGNNSSSNVGAGGSNKRSRLVMSAANSRRSVAVSDAILVAQSTFAGGEFQPEVFARCACLLLETFEGGDNAVRLCAVRLLEQYRPYFASTIISVEIAQRASQLLSHDDPTTRELCLDLLTSVTIAIGGLPAGILRDIGRSLRSPFPAERQAAARAYASCLCVRRSSDDGIDSPSASSTYPKTLDGMAVLSLALLPTLTWSADGVGCIPKAGKMEGSLVSGGINFGPASVEELTDAVLSKVDGGLPSTELWEAVKAFLLDAGNVAPTRSRAATIEAVVDIILSRLRSSAAAAAAATPALEMVVDVHTATSSSSNSSSSSSSILRAIAVDFLVSLVHVEAVWRNKRAADPSKGSGGSAPSPGRNAVRSLLVALASSSANRPQETAELVAVLGAPALTNALFDAEIAAGMAERVAAAAAEAAEAEAEAAAREGGESKGESGGKRSGSGGGGRKVNSLAKGWFPLATAAVGRLRELSSSSSASSPTLPPSGGPSATSVVRGGLPFGGVSLACMAALVSFSVAAFRRSPPYPAAAAGGDASAREAALSALAELAAEAALSCPPSQRLLSGRDNADASAGPHMMLPQLRALAAVHAWPRRRVGVAVVKCLSKLSNPGCPLAVELSVLASHVVRAGEDGGAGEDGDERTEVGQDAAGETLWAVLFGRRFSDVNPKAAVGVAVALMRCHRGSVERQSILSAALVEAMGNSGNARSDTQGQNNHQAMSDYNSADMPDTRAEGSKGSAEADLDRGGHGDDPLVRDPWFQLVLCRECMLHGYFDAAEAGLRRLRRGGYEDEMAGKVTMSDVVCVWTEVLTRVSAAEAFFGGSSDPVAAHACAAHETLQAADVLGSLPRYGDKSHVAVTVLEAGAAGGGARRVPHVPSHRPGCTASSGEGRNILGTFQTSRADFSFQRSFLLARAELLQLLGAAWAMCQDLSAARGSRYARYTRREGRCRRLPAAFRCLAKEFRTLRGLRPGAGTTTTEPLRAASCLCLLLAIAADALLNQGKSVLIGSRDKFAAKKKNYRGWLERLAAGADDVVEAEGVCGSSEGALMKSVRVLGERLLGLGSPPSAPVGRAAFTSILESVRSIPFPIPRAFFRTGGDPRVALKMLPPPPQTISGVSPDMVAVDNNGWPGGQQDQQQLQQQQQQQHQEKQQQQQQNESMVAPGSPSANDDASGDLRAEPRQKKRDGGASARYFGPSSRALCDPAGMPARARRPALPLISSADDLTDNINKNNGDSTTEFDGDTHSRRGFTAGRRSRAVDSEGFSPSEAWWAQAAREEALSDGGDGVRGNGGGWPLRLPSQLRSPGVWLLQGSVRSGGGAGGLLPSMSEFRKVKNHGQAIRGASSHGKLKMWADSEGPSRRQLQTNRSPTFQVILEVSVQLPTAAEPGGTVPIGSQGGPSTLAMMQSSILKKWTKKVVAETFGTAADSRSAVCFRVEVLLPPLEGASRIEVAVSLKSLGKQDAAYSNTGFSPLGSSSCGHGKGGMVGSSGEREVWMLGKVFIPLTNYQMAPRSAGVGGVAW